MKNLVYRFNYDGVKRRALVLQEVPSRFSNTKIIKCWSFSDDGYRNFDLAKVEDLENITNSVKIIKDSNNLYNKYQEAGCSVFEFTDFAGNELLYVVNLGE